MFFIHANHLLTQSRSPHETQHPAVPSPVRRCSYTVEIGPHGGIHYVIGGDPGGDLFTSPADPAFWVHHGQMNRLWSSWQLLDLSGGRFKEDQMNGGEYGHMTWANEPPSRKARFDDVLHMGYAAESTTIGEVMSTLGGELCYLYL